MITTCTLIVILYYMVYAFYLFITDVFDVLCVHMFIQIETKLDKIKLVLYSITLR